MEFNRNYFIKKFLRIPPKMWLTGHYGEKPDGPHCALGHCGVSSSLSFVRSPQQMEGEQRAIVEVFSKIKNVDFKRAGWGVVHTVNDSAREFGSNARKRTICFLIANFKQEMDDADEF